MRAPLGRAASRLVAAALGGFAIVCSMSAVARAEPTHEERALADVRFREGRDLLDRQRYDDACPKFEESERLSPRGAAVLNLAICREKQGRLATAWAAYVRAIALAEREGTSDREEIARKKVAELQWQLSWLVIQVPKEVDVASAVVLLDGTPVGRRAWGVPVPVDAGHHVIVASAPGVAAIEITVNVGPRGDRKEVFLPHPPGGASQPKSLPSPGPVVTQPRPPADPRSPGVVRLHLDTRDPRVRLFMTAPPGAGVADRPICAAPCDAIVDGRDGQFLYIDGDGISRSKQFHLSDKKGELIARVSSGRSGVRGLGFALAILGGSAAFGGGFLLLVSSPLSSSENNHGIETRNSLVPIGGVLLGIGSAIVVGGVVLFLTSRTRLELDDGHGTKFKVGAGPRLTPSGAAIAF